MAGEEPSLRDALDDPIVCLVMARDGLDPEAVKAEMRRMTTVLRNRETRVR
jgi:hypothetical protein